MGGTGLLKEDQGGISRRFPTSLYKYLNLGISVAEGMLKWLLLALALGTCVNGQALENPLQGLFDQMHFEHLAEPYTYQRIGYDLQRIAYEIQYPENKKYYDDKWKPLSWSDVFGPEGKGK